MSVISSENVFNLQFINEEARDLFADRLFLFVLFFLVNKAGGAVTSHVEEDEPEPEDEHASADRDNGL